MKFRTYYSTFLTRSKFTIPASKTVFSLQKEAQSTSDKIKSLEPKIRLSEQSNLKNSLKNPLWCPGEDLNLHKPRLSFHNLLS